MHRRWHGFGCMVEENAGSPLPVRRSRGASSGLVDQGKGNVGSNLIGQDHAHPAHASRLVGQRISAFGIVDRRQHGRELLKLRGQDRDSRGSRS